MILYMALMMLMGFWFKIFKGGHRAEKYEAQAMLAVRPEGQDAAKTNWLPVCLVVVFVMACFLIPVAAQSGWWTCKCTIPSAIYIAFIRCPPVY